jgi:hypothetical protein
MTIKEHTLLQLWYSQYLDAIERESPVCFETTDGRKVEIIHRGRWNFDTGPDFQSALLRIGGQLREGDVEIHRKASEWYAHKHEKDPHYNRVILHVVLREDLGRPILCQDQHEIPTLILSQFLKSSDLSDLEKSLEVSSRSVMPCLQEIMNLSQEAVWELIQEKADKRFQQKVQRFTLRYQRAQTEAAGYKVHQVWDHLIYEGFMEALGYSINKKPFLTLAQCLPLSHIQKALSVKQSHENDPGWDRVIWLQAILLGTAGLLPAPSFDKPETYLESIEKVRSLPGKGDNSGARFVDLTELPVEETYLNELQYLWRMLKPFFMDIAMRPEAWQFFRTRPANAPTSRLARFSVVLSMLLERSEKTTASWIDWYATLLMDSADGSTSPTKRATQTVKKLEETLLVPISGYWKYHTNFKTRISKPSGHSRSRSVNSVQFALGRNTIREMIINVLLPILFLYAEKKSWTKLQTTISSLYKIYPAPAYNAVTKFMMKTLFGQNRSGMKNPIEQARYAFVHQGLIQLHNELCRMKSCPSCPYRTL